MTRIEDIKEALHGYTLDEISEWTGIHRNTAHNTLSGKSDPTLSTVNKLMQMIEAMT